MCPTPPPSRSRKLLRKWLGSSSLSAGTILLIPVLLLAILAPLITWHEPNAVNLQERLLPPSGSHPFGTDELGRDLFSRVLFGTRTSLAVAFGIISIGSSFGTIIGTFSGYLGGRIDNLTMRLVDVFMAIPFLVIALALTAALGPSLVNLMIAVGILSIPFYARMARGLALTLRSQPYVLAAWAMGASVPYIIRRHIIPNMVSQMIVVASINMSGAILISSALSFIGLGAQPPMAELGSIISGSRSYILDEWWYTLFPGIFLVVSAFGFNLLGDGLRDFFDPSESNS